MSLDAAPDRLEVRTSLQTVTAWVVVLVVLGSGLSFCSTAEESAPANPWLMPGLLLAGGLAVFVWTFTQRAPRFILDATGIFWREGRHKIYEHLPWSQIRSAGIEPGGEDEVTRLRLHLEPRPAPERVASEGARRWVDISIDTVDIHERRLRRVINQLAPHLFPGAARSRIDLTAT